MSRHPRPRLGRLALLLVLGVVAAVTVAGRPATAQPGTDPARIDRGRTLYQASCASCHGQAGEGSQRGPTLIGVGAASVDFYLQTGRMPLATEQQQARRGPQKFSQPDIEALIGYVAGFGGDGPGIPAVHAGDLGQGRELYLQNCASCHSSSGTGYAQVGGEIAPSILQSDPKQVAEAVRVGPALMPEFSDGVLDQRQLDAVVTYVGELQRLPDRGGASLGRIGPVSETVVGFLGLALLVVVVRLVGRRTS
jgi:ubiquinol-cytochrome c reductase cytochrome c subunit